MAKGKHPNSLAALEPTKWKKGQKPEGSGRPKGALSYKERFAKYMALERKLQLPDGKIEDGNILDGVILKALAVASQGDIKAMEFCFNRAFGKEPDKHEITGKDGQPLEIEHSQRLQEAWGSITDAFAITHNRADEGSKSQ